MKRRRPSARASLRTKPSHVCCPNAGNLLEPRSSSGRWAWVLRLPKPLHLWTVRIIYCPWCGQSLPTERPKPRPVLQLVRSEEPRS